MKSYERQELARLATSINPLTGQLYTDAELAVTFHRHPTALALIRSKELGISRLPQAIDYSPPKAEQAYFLAMVLSSYSATLINAHARGEHPIIKIITAARSNQTIKKHLDVVLKGVGVPNQDKALYGYYLHPKRFAFLLDPIKTTRKGNFLDTIETFAPLLFELLTQRLSPNNYLALRKSLPGNSRETLNQLLLDINTSVQGFGLIKDQRGQSLPLGRVYKSSHGESKYIRIRTDHYLQAVTTLAGGDTVRNLRFHQRLVDWSNQPVIDSDSSPVPDLNWQGLKEEYAENKAKEAKLARQAQTMTLQARNFLMKNLDSRLGNPFLT